MDKEVKIIKDKFKIGRERIYINSNSFFPGYLALLLLLIYAALFSFFIYAKIYNKTLLPNFYTALPNIYIGLGLGVILFLLFIVYLIFTVDRSDNNIYVSTYSFYGTTVLKLPLKVSLILEQARLNKQFIINVDKKSFEYLDVATGNYIKVKIPKDHRINLCYSIYVCKNKKYLYVRDDSLISVDKLSSQINSAILLLKDQLNIISQYSD